LPGSGSVCSSSAVITRHSPVLVQNAITVLAAICGSDVACVLKRVCPLYPVTDRHKNNLTTSAQRFTIPKLYFTLNTV
jgi:hypothetical protein